MRTIITLFILFLGNAAFSQTVLIKGTATDTISLLRREHYSSFKVVLNDTINRFITKKHHSFLETLKVKGRESIIKALRADSIADVELQKLYKNKDYAVVPSKNGEFQIMARPTDTLYFESFRFITQKYAVSDLMKMKEINIRLLPQVCEEVFRCNEEHPKLYVFIGEKIEVKGVNPYYCNVLSTFDNKYEAKYKVLKNMHGDLKQDTVSFTVYDHNDGMPKFADYKYVMLFVSEHCGRLFHEKYQYFDVYPSANGGWVRAGDPYQLDQNQTKFVNAVPVKYRDSISFNVDEYPVNYVKALYPEPYFKIKDNKVYPVLGVDAETLFSIKKAGILKVRGFSFND